MFNILQTLYNTEKKEIVLYLGIKGQKVIVKNKKEKIYSMNIENLKAIRDDESKKILVGNQVKKFGVLGEYFGIVKEKYWKKVQPDLSLEKYIKKEVKCA